MERRSLCLPEAIKFVVEMVFLPAPEVRENLLADLASCSSDTE